MAGSGSIEDSGDARARFSGANHVRGRAAAEQQAQGIHNDRFTAAGFAGE